MDEDTQHSLDLIKALDEMIAQGNWEGGLFFQAAGKKLRDLSDRLKKELELETGQTATATDMIDYVKQKSGLVEVYISLYCAEGANIKRWESVLLSLPKQIIGRPIYKREKDVKDSINAKGNPMSDAYAFAYVTEMDLLKPSFRDKATVDRFGHELIRLKDNSLKMDNVTKLIHTTGEYAYRNGVLVKL